MEPKLGRIIDQDGFDEQTGIYVQLPAPAEPIGEHVGEAQARDAVDVLWKPFEFFPFADAQDGRISRSVFLAAILTAVTRRLLLTAPGFLISATSPGSEKRYGSMPGIFDVGRYT